MLRTLAGALVVLACHAAAFGQVKAVITGPGTASPGDLVVLSAADSFGAEDYAWVLVGSDKTFLPVDDGQKVVFATGLPGRYSFVLAVSGKESEDGDKSAVSQALHTVTVGTPPVPPVPPGPDPPVPPDPPGPAPIPVDGFRVLVVYESADVTKMPRPQQAILSGAEVRQYLDSQCATEADGTKAYRFYDAHIDLSNDLAVWKDAMARPRQSLPWVIVSNGKSGFEGPLPATTADFLALCKKYEVK